MTRSTLAAALALLLGASSAFADVGEKLSSYEQETRNLGADLPKPNEKTGSLGERRLVDAQVAYSLGDYDQAALALFELVGKLSGPDKETATYYLGEALYQKGDKGAARAYLSEIAANSMSKYYAQAQVRLVEIAIAQSDFTAGSDTLAKLASVGNANAAVPYVKGKFAFAQGKYDEALTAFGEVPKGSDYELQALYYTATTQVAKKDLAKSIDLFSDLISRKPRTAADRRVIELGELALGRLFYEREQPSKSIDAYLLIDRHSDLFPDALYEVAWVYVKGKQYDKALRALELLEQSDPTSTKTPTTRILEGNLRIRKAQSIRLAQVNGTVAMGEATDPALEYDKATKIFQETHDLYAPSYQTLSALVDGNLDAAAFVEQIAGRQSHVFQASAPLPDAAAQMLRDQPEVERVVGVETDLGTIQSDITEAEATIVRLESMLASGDHMTVYPKLSSRRMRIAQIQHDLIGIRNNLAEQELSLLDKSGDIMQVSGARQLLAQQYGALGDPEKAYTDRLGANRSAYDQADSNITEVEHVIDTSQAMSVAMRKYAIDANPPLAADLKGTVQTTLDDAAKEAQAIEDEIADARREATLGKDLAGVNDQGIMQARALRKQLKGAQDAEHRVLAGFASASHDRGRSQNLAALGDRAARLADTLDQTDQQIDRLIAQGLDEVRGLLAQERQNLTAYKAELAENEAEARTLGASVLASSFKDVKAKFYDIVVRTDVGVVDVAWSQKEDTDDDLKRLNLARNRELKQLHDEFKDVLEDNTKKPSSTQKVTNTLPSTEGQPPVTSPDKQTGKPGDDRVKPVGDQPKTNTQPTVKPDEQKKGAPKTPPKTPAPKGGAK